MSGLAAGAGAQRFVVHGLRLDRARHFALSVESTPQARAFVARLAALACADEASTQRGLAVGLTYSGLRALRLPASHLGAFRMLAPEFAQGAAVRAGTALGDVGHDAPREWGPAFTTPRTHVWLSVFADHWNDIDAWVDAHATAQSGLSGWGRGFDTEHLDGKDRRKEPFGFREGISQPTMKGVHPHGSTRNPPNMHVAPGEFLLGHADERGANRWGAPQLSAEVRDFVRNGSFGALRKMRQDVAGFTAWRTPLERAQLCGRWPNGAPVLPGAEAEPPEPEPHALNSFDYSQDREGRGCPFSAHIRRMNPRADAVALRRKPLLVRRAMPYSDGDERGLFGMFLCTNLRQQFEFLLEAWGRSPPMTPGMSAPDKFIRDFVTTRGTLYVFYPSRAALEALGSLP